LCLADTNYLTFPSEGFLLNVRVDNRLDRQASNLSPALYKEHQTFWQFNQPKLADITLKMPDACVDEFDRLVKGQASYALTEDVRRAIPQTVELANQVRDQLENGCGAALIDRLPADRYNVKENRKICGYFSSMIAPLMEQNFAGVKLYDVIDKKGKEGTKVRRSITNLRQDYHTDGGWLSEPARYIGLYCISSAEQGGFSRITSIMDAYKSMMNGDERVGIEKLSENHPWDRQGEHGQSEKPYNMNPLFVSRDNGFMSRWYESYVRNGYALQEKNMDESTNSSLSFVADFLDRQKNIRFLLEAGQFQYVNNHTVVHGRESFEDGQGGGGRHLIRVWHRV